MILLLLSRRIAKIHKEDIQDEINFWSTAVVCYVTSANPPLHVIEGFVRRIWKDQEIDRIGIVNRGVFLCVLCRKNTKNRLVA